MEGCQIRAREQNEASCQEDNVSEVSESPNGPVGKIIYGSHVSLPQRVVANGVKKAKRQGGGKIQECAVPSALVRRPNCEKNGDVGYHRHGVTRVEQNFQPSRPHTSNETQDQRPRAL